LHHDDLPFVEQILNHRARSTRLIFFLFTFFSNFFRLIFVVIKIQRAFRIQIRAHVGHIQESGAIQTDVDESRLHAGEDAHNPTFVDGAD
jgi:hypothetical protein